MTLLVLGSVNTAVAATVNWLDPLSYAKPMPVDIAMPNETTVTNKYYVDLSSGSGTTCSSGSPCRSIDDLAGKPGTTGGPAYVYVRGTGGLSLFNDTFYGSPGNEIVIKPWPGFTATFTGNSNTNSTSVHDIIFDGGPSLGIAFVSDGASDAYSFHIISDNTTIYRTKNYSTQSGGSLLLSIGDTRVVNGVRIINNEFYGCNTASGFQCSAIYAGPGSGGGYSNLLIQNNIVRDMGGDGIEINPRATSSGLTITGNAIHNVGKQTCSGSWLCRPAITLNSQNGQSNPNIVIQNNLMWDIGSGCIWARTSGSPQVIYNNTCYDYGKISPNTNSSPNPQGVSGGTASSIKNNIIYAPNGTDPFDGSYSASNNLCGSGKSCGTSSQTWSAGFVLSIDQATSNFMQVGASSQARNTGVTISSVTSSYGGVSRPQETAFDIGAFEAAGSGGSVPPQSPTNLRIIP